MATLYIPNVISRTTKSVDWLFDRDQEAADEAAAAAWDRRRSIERAVTREDLLEEVTMTFTEAQDETFMQALDRDDAWTLLALLDQVKQQIVKRRLAGGE